MQVAQRSASHSKTAQRGSQALRCSTAVWHQRSPSARRVGRRRRRRRRRGGGCESRDDLHANGNSASLSSLGRADSNKVVDGSGRLEGACETEASVVSAALKWHGSMRHVSTCPLHVWKVFAGAVPPRRLSTHSLQATRQAGRQAPHRRYLPNTLPVPATDVGRSQHIDHDVPHSARLLRLEPHGASNHFGRREVAEHFHREVCGQSAAADGRRGQLERLRKAAYRGSGAGRVR